ncbi:hypothetical protein MMC07_008380 [Pseudocyphellaria aurata]|nr:hypothetical protein [Pseudocyphellaria aurata]
MLQAGLAFVTMVSRERLYAKELYLDNGKMHLHREGVRLATWNDSRVTTALRTTLATRRMKTNQFVPPKVAERERVLGNHEEKALKTSDSEKGSDLLKISDLNQTTQIPGPTLLDVSL